MPLTAAQSLRMEYEYNLGQFFSRMAKENSKGIALRMAKDKSVTFLELEKESNRIALFLRSKGIATGQVLGILNNKTCTAYATMLACLKEGIIYANLDPKSPVERFKKMLDLCQPQAVFYSSRDNHSLINEVPKGTWVPIDYSALDFKEQIQELAWEEWAGNSTVTANTSAYIMFTSGSTGFPKKLMD